MFTGLVRGIGKVEEVSPLQGGGRRLRIAVPSGFPEPAAGASIACAGVCLTARECRKDGFVADVSEESLACSTLGAWQKGDAVNLEPSLAAGEPLGGHLVLGHVDGTAEVAACTAEGEFKSLAILLPARFAPYLAPKGSLALDGVSLTLNRVEKRADKVEAHLMLIPETLVATGLGVVKAGDRLNMEIDPLARYAVRAVEALR